ncbi:MAG: 3'(2'),5'-bisphosphate nucleotidase CysQ [Pseudomonadota bacterium]
MAIEQERRALAEALLPAVVEAGRIEMAYFVGAVEIERKADASPVTAADRDAEAVLLAALAEAAPSVPVVAEEEVAAGQVPAIGDTFFLVDPLDGTREFIDRRPEFTINIGLVTGGQPVFGIVYAPASHRFYLGLGTGAAYQARLDPARGTASLAACDLQPIATRVPDQRALVVMDSRSHRSPETEAFLARYDVASATHIGSSLKFCLIAAGEGDLYPRLGPTCEWDTAAAHAVLAAAGGSVTTLDGAPLVYGKAGARFLNPHFVAWGRGPLPPAR